jgi:alkanesulfonate monooxygenase SsuD/methylene tetrahydromethanopterin reductase-like flavin-dependent oxidoreductase (luciferase family)
MTETRPLAVGITPMETRRDVLVHLATRAEELGYTAFLVGEAWGHDASVVLAEVAMRTTRIRIGTGVLNVWGRSAATIAMLATSLHELSDGRFLLGLGTGSPQLAEGLHDVTFQAPATRLEATIRQVRRLLDGDRITPSNPAGSRPLRLGVRPPSHIPIAVAALGPNAVAVAEKLADIWFPFLTPASALTPATRGVNAATTGRSLPQIWPAIPIAVSHEEAEARATASWWIAFYLTSMSPLYARNLRRLGLGAAVDEVLTANPTRGTANVPDSAQVLLDELTIWGDPDRARASLDRWYAAGADMPVIVLPPNRSPDELEHALKTLSPATFG